MNDIEKAKQLLFSDELTFSAVKNEQIMKDTERGVAPLLKLIDSSSSLTGFSAADKVIGKAAAFLYVLLDVKCVYAAVISEPALSVMQAYDIDISFDKLVPAIRNRANTGFCPMETAVKDIDDPKQALDAIRKKRQELSK